MPTIMRLERHFQLFKILWFTANKELSGYLMPNSVILNKKQKIIVSVSQSRQKRRYRISLTRANLVEARQVYTRCKRVNISPVYTRVKCVNIDPVYTRIKLIDVGSVWTRVQKFSTCVKRLDIGLVWMRFKWFDTGLDYTRVKTKV